MYKVTWKEVNTSKCGSFTAPHIQSVATELMMLGYSSSVVDTVCEDGEYVGTFDVIKLEKVK